MAATWPPSLPQKFNQSGFSNNFADNVIRSSMAVGPDKKRRRDVSAPEPIQGNITIDETQYDTLKTFHDTTLAGGALEFDWVHPITGLAATMTFVQPPSLVARSGDYYTATLSLEILT